MAYNLPTENTSRFNNEVDKNLFAVDNQGTNSRLFFYLKEIRYRLFYILLCLLFCFLISYFYSEQLIYIFIRPFLVANPLLQQKFIFLEITEAFYSFFKISLILSLYGTFPFVVYQMWCFLICSCYELERYKVKSVLFYFVVFFVFTNVIIYVYLIPIIWEFFLNYEKMSYLIQIELSAQISSYISQLMQIVLYSNLCLLFFYTFIYLVQLGYVNNILLLNIRKHMYFVFLTVAALLSPPDIVSQLLITFVFGISFECILIYSYIICFYKKKEYIGHYA